MYNIKEEAGTDSEKGKQTERNGSVMDGLWGEATARLKIKLITKHNNVRDVFLCNYA